MCYFINTLPDRTGPRRQRHTPDDEPPTRPQRAHGVFLMVQVTRACMSVSPNVPGLVDKSYCDIRTAQVPLWIPTKCERTSRFCLPRCGIRVVISCPRQNGSSRCHRYKVKDLVHDTRTVTLYGFQAFVPHTVDFCSHQWQPNTDSSRSVYQCLHKDVQPCHNLHFVAQRTVMCARLSGMYLSEGYCFWFHPIYDVTGHNVCLLECQEYTAVISVLRFWDAFGALVLRGQRQGERRDVSIVPKKPVKTVLHLTTVNTDQLLCT